jgi:uncharacterized phage-associated protein
MKLIKLLYLADRKALLELGRPITFDRFVSMPHGPVLSRTYDLITAEPDPEEVSYWAKHISPRTPDYEVRLIAETPTDQLSPAEELVLEAIFTAFGHLGRYQVRDYTHTLPEWHDPHGGSIPISVREVLVVQGVDAEDAKAIAEDLESETFLESMVG